MHLICSPGIAEIKMTTNVISSINVCPIHFEKFASINRITNNLEASLLFSKLKFHQTHSKIKKNGKTWVVRSREQIAAWFGFSTKRVDKIISTLESVGLLEKKSFPMVWQEKTIY